MTLRTLYSDNIIRLSTGESCGCSYCGYSYSVEGETGTVIYPYFDEGYKPMELEIMFFSSYMPLETNDGYCSDTDTLVIGKGKNTATLVERNGDLAAYWVSDEYDPDDLDLVAVSLENASKHLGPAIAAHAAKERGAKMSLRTSCFDDCISLSISEGGHSCYGGSCDVGGAIIDFPDPDCECEGKYKPKALEMLFVSGLMPLETKDRYCSDTDTLVFGKGKNTATMVERNGDLVAYWAPDEYDPDDLDLVAFDLENASKHLAPAFAAHAAGERGAEMSLRKLYSGDIISLSTGEEGDGCRHVKGEQWTVIDLPDGEYKPVALEIMFVSSEMPLETNDGYCSDTDTLVIGKGKNTATLVERNGDLAAYWASDEYDPDDLDLVAVAIQNASKHLAPVIAAHAAKEQGLSNPPA